MATFASLRGTIIKLQHTMPNSISTSAPDVRPTHPSHVKGQDMNQQFGKQAFDQAEKLFKDARIPENVQAIAQQSVAATQEIYTKTAAAAQGGAKAFTEIADTAWGSAKMLNEKVVQNVTANFE